MEPVLELRGISKSFPGVRALDNVSFAVGRGEVLGLIGENGAGKSTLLKVLNGIYQPDSGSVRVDGKEVRLTAQLPQWKETADGDTVEVELGDDAGVGTPVPRSWKRIPPAP